MLGNFFNRQNSQNETPNKSVESVSTEKVVDSNLQKKHIKNKKNILGENFLTREEVLKEIEKQLSIKQSQTKNPFKTQADVYYCFMDSNNNPIRGPIPFEEITIDGKKFYIHKKFENGKIIIEELYAPPILNYDPQEELAKIETTKKQIENISKYILEINNKIAEGDDRYKLMDIEDLRYEKWKLETVLESVKYGSRADFIFPDFHNNNRQTYYMRYNNGSFKYIKITPNNTLTEDHSGKTAVGHQIEQKLEEVVNMRINRNWAQLAIAVAIIVFLFIGFFGFYKLTTHDQVLFDQRVKEYCADNIGLYQSQLEEFRSLTCFDPQTQEDQIRDFNVAR